MLWLSVAVKIKDVLFDYMTLVFEFMFDAVDFALNRLNRTLSEVLGLAILALLAGLLFLILLLMYQELLDFLPALVSENTHGQFEVAQLLLGPPSIAVQRIIRHSQTDFLEHVMAMSTLFMAPLMHPNFLLKRQFLHFGLL